MSDETERALEATWRKTQDFGDWLAWARVTRRRDPRPLELGILATRLAALEERIVSICQRIPGPVDHTSQITDRIYKVRIERIRERAGVVEVRLRRRISARVLGLLDACLWPASGFIGHEGEAPTFRQETTTRANRTARALAHTADVLRHALSRRRMHDCPSCPGRLTLEPGQSFGETVMACSKCERVVHD